LAQDSDGESCTATLIDPQWIVLAGHCQWGGSEENPVRYKPNQLKFQIGEDYSKPELSVALSEWVALPDEAETNIDIAFGKLSKAIRLVETKVAGKKVKRDIKPIPLSLEKLEAGDESFEIVGFGFTETSGFGSQNGKRGKANYKITATKGNPFLALFKTVEKFKEYLKAAHPGDEDAVEQIIPQSEITEDASVHAWDSRGRENGVLTSKPQGGWGNSCNGDSGGPMLSVEAGNFKVVGVILGGFVGSKSACVDIGSKIGIFGPEIKKLIKDHKIPVPGL
jgi:hypothetical protein